MTNSKCIYGYYPTDDEWLPIKVDSNGRVIVDPSLLFENPPTEDETKKGPSSEWAFDHAADPDAHQDTGGKPGLNKETLTGNKTLTPWTDYIHQHLDNNHTTRIVTLATAGASAGDRFVILSTQDYNNSAYIDVQQGGTTIERIYSLGLKSFIFDGTNWRGNDIGTRVSYTYGLNVMIGHRSIAYDTGFACGGYAYAWNKGMAIGFSAEAYDYGTAVGSFAQGRVYGVAMGYGTNTGTFRYSIAIGMSSRCYRVGEMATNINPAETQINNYTQGRWCGDTSDNTPTEIYCANYSTSRFTINANSALAFRVTVVARDDTAGDVAMYTFEGLIKRDGAGNTTMSVCNKTVVHEDDATWDCAVTADDTNEALVITVTGDADNPTQWAAVLEGVETKFAS